MNEETLPAAVTGLPKTSGLPESLPESGLIGDPWLAPHRSALRARWNRLKKTLATFAPTGGLAGDISQGHRYFGFTRGWSHGEEGIWYREWAPEALSLRLIGDFNGWNRDANPLARDTFGVWHTFLPDSLYGKRIGHGSPIKVHVVGQDGTGRDRIPAYARRVTVNPETQDPSARIWLPETVDEEYTFRYPIPHIPSGEGLRIYEAHVGMSQEAERVGTFNEFRENILPRIAHLGYNALQLMAVQEHPYYASFGYHVSSFYAVSSRFGTPEDLKRLIDEAHKLGLLVLLDLVHSHAVKNVNEGLNNFDGTDHQYFHAGKRGIHPTWDSLLFDYGKYEVRRFLLSNVRWWLEEFHFDGFRFDGVTSMLYHDHGLEKPFLSYNDYFPPRTEEDAVTYLQMANLLAHTIKPDVITVAEDVSGMIGIASPISDGGIGFDYRLAMGVPDYWVRLVKEKRDEDWNVREIYMAMVNRRWSEKHIGYAESHDQAMVGDKTLSHRMIDTAIYWEMGKESKNLIVDRGVALHKMIRLTTFALAGEGYLNFMGNEFGHPEWIDFPRDGNDHSYKYARRQWSLADRHDLRYEQLQAFDIAMQGLDKEYHLLPDQLVEELLINENDKVMIFRHGRLVFAFNYHPTASYTGYRIPVPDASDYHLILDSDAQIFGGYGRVAAEATFPYQYIAQGTRAQSISLYLPSRTALVLAPV